MPFSNPLDPATPSGGSNANQLDDRIREVKAALIERLLTLVTDVDLNPLVMKPLTVPVGALVDNAVTTVKIADNAITQPKMADNSVGTAEIIDLNVTTAKINDLAVTGAKIAAGAVTTAKMAAVSVDDTILADNAVKTAKILDANVTAAKLAANAVTTVKILDAAVTTAKIADAAVNTVKIAPVEQALMAIMLAATRVLTQAETSIPNDQYKEYDIAMAGAQVGKPVIVQWTGTGYPNNGAPLAGGWAAGDQLTIFAWCILAGTIRVRISNRTGGALDMGVTGATVKVFQLQWLDQH